jgi:hypothetical protein
MSVPIRNNIHLIALECFDLYDKKIIIYYEIYNYRFINRIH